MFIANPNMEAEAMVTFFKIEIIVISGFVSDNKYVRKKKHANHTSFFSIKFCFMIIKKLNLHFTLQSIS